MVNLNIWRLFDKPVLELAASLMKLNAVLFFLSSITTKTPLAEIFNKVRGISGKFSPPPPVLLNAGEKVAEHPTVANLFASHFANISRKDPGAPRDKFGG